MLKQTRARPLAEAIPLPWFLKAICLPGPLHRLYQEVEARQDLPFWRSLLQALGITYEVHGADRILPHGRAVVVANHAFGLLDAAVACDLLSSVRADVRVLTNYLIAGIPRLRGICLPVNPFRTPEGKAMNRAALQAATDWLDEDGMLLVFPAGEVASLDWRQRAVIEPTWYPTAARLARAAQAPLLPLRVGGSNSRLFHALGVLHPALRTLRLPYELLNKRGQQLEVWLGQVCSAADFAGSDAELSQELRRQVIALGSTPLPDTISPSVPEARAVRG